MEDKIDIKRVKKLTEEISEALKLSIEINNLIEDLKPLIYSVIVASIVMDIVIKSEKIKNTRRQPSKGIEFGSFEKVKVKRVPVEVEFNKKDGSKVKVKATKIIKGE